MSDDLHEDLGQFPQLLGLEMIEWREGHCRLDLVLRPEHLNRYNIPHGGLHCTLLDTAMGYAGCWTGDPEHELRAMTLTLNTSFLSRPEGQRLIAVGRKTGGGARTFFADGTLHCDKGTLLATASGAFRYRNG